MADAVTNEGAGRGDRGRRRITSFVLALSIELLFVLGLLQLFAPLPPRSIERALIALDLRAPSSAAPPRPETARKGTEHPAAKIELRQPPPKILVPTTSYVRISKADFEAGDISKLPRQAAGSDSEGEGETASTGNGKGEGPGGAPLYAAEWYREPTDGELAPYLPEARPDGAWAMIMCQTVADRRVDNCRPMSESPPGSGLANALRRASWQFRVMPPRVGRTALIGAWVRIRFDFSERKG